MDPIPHTQHHSICVLVELVVVPQATPFKRRFNLRRADWISYATELDKLILDVEPTLANYNCFVKSVRTASRRHIPKECRAEFIPGLTEESKSLYEAYKTQYSNSPFDDGTMESGNTLLDSMIEEKKSSRQQT